MMKNGQKTIELRLYDEKRQKVKEGDEIVFTNVETNETLKALVLKLHRFDSFETLNRLLPLLKCGYAKDNVSKATSSDMERYYSAAEQKRYGVVGIEISLLKGTTD
ncbi:MAG: RNA-binding protein [Clostridia bacterium]|nr:RNA-binding protein [Clostridia bacterium]